MCNSKEVPNCITSITICYQKAEIMIIGCHLSSNNYGEDDEYHTPGEIERIDGVMSYLKSVGYASGKRVMQAKNVSSMMRENVPTIVLGDMNDVCGSPCLYVLKESGLKDGWREKGLGYGATIHHLIPFRIDHVMHNNNIELLNIEKIDCSSISDHDA